MACADSRWQAFAGRYVDGRLSEEERTAFENHYFACDACFGDVESLQAARGEGTSAASAAGPVAAAPRARAWWPVAIAAVLAMTIGVVVWPLLKREGRGDSARLRGSAPTASVEERAPVLPAAPGPQPPADAEVASASGGAPIETTERPLFSIAEVTPPRYDPVVLRGAEDDAEARFRAAMATYQEGDYNGAIPELEAAARLAPEAARIRFFLGASRLLAGDVEPAIESLERVVSLGETPYLEEAKLLLAKAHLVEGDTASAAQRLEEVSAMKGDLGREAEELLARIREEDEPAHD
jgi:tetratricopeptide (TPR) repeat protein